MKGFIGGMVVFSAALVMAAAIGGLLGRVYDLQQKLKLAEVPLYCSCSLRGGNDESSWDVDLGQTKATKFTVTERIIPSRAACGPLLLRAYEGADAP